MDQALHPDAELPMERVLYEVKKVIVGQDHLLERLVVALLARGHMLVEGVPGLAKTMAIKTLADAIGGEFKRIQFTPDLVPADLIGTRIYNQKTGEFSTALGPVFTNLLLADEINRAPAKVQSALLEVMQERQVTIGRETFDVPNPFLVLATQNPIETEGTYPLPEAQIDRFMLKVLVGYPSATDEFVIVERMISALQAVREVVTTEQLLSLQQAAGRVYVDPALIQYAIQIVGATRPPQEVGLPDVRPYGADPGSSCAADRDADARTERDPCAGRHCPAQRRREQRVAGPAGHRTTGREPWHPRRHGRDRERGRGDAAYQRLHRALAPRCGYVATDRPANWWRLLP